MHRKNDNRLPGSVALLVLSFISATILHASAWLVAVILAAAGGALAVWFLLDSADSTRAEKLLAALLLLGSGCAVLLAAL